MSRSGREKQGDAHASGAGYANGRNLSEVFGEVGNDGDITGRTWDRGSRIRSGSHVS